MSEHKIHSAIATYLEINLPASIRMVSVPNNPRSAVAGALEKARGSKKGFPDFILINGAQQGAIAGFEVKQEGKYMSPEQREWRDWFVKHRIPHFTVRSIDDVRESLAELHIVTREARAA